MVSPVLQQLGHQDNIRIKKQKQHIVASRVLANSPVEVAARNLLCKVDACVVLCVSGVAQWFLCHHLWFVLGFDS